MLIVNPINTKEQLYEIDLQNVWTSLEMNRNNLDEIIHKLKRRIRAESLVGWFKLIGDPTYLSPGPGGRSNGQWGKRRREEEVGEEDFSSRVVKL